MKSVKRASPAAGEPDGAGGGGHAFERVQALYERGGLVAGTSAGASVVCETMLVAGNGEQGSGGDGGASRAAQLNNPSGLALDPAGRLYVADTGNHRVRRISRFEPRSIDQTCRAYASVA